MTVNPELAAQAVQMPMEGLRFGPYEVQQLTEQPVITMRGESSLATTQRDFAFQLKDSKDRMWRAVCESTVKSKSQGTQIVAGTGIVNLNCTIQGSNDRSKKWSLAFSGFQSATSKRSGEVTGKRTRLEIRSTDALGFDITFRDRPIAAVQTSSSRVIWMDRALSGDMRSVIAVSAAGLVIFEHLTKDT